MLFQKGESQRERELIYPKEMKLRKAVLVAYLSYLDVSE